MPSSTRYPRRGENDDFGRVVTFTDAVFAIAMTLLVVEIGVPERAVGHPTDPAVLLDAISDKGPLLFAFFLGCYVIGSYWVAHHRFMSWLAAVDRGFLFLTVVYLSFVALLPFPTGVLGSAGDRAVVPGHPPRDAPGPAPAAGSRPVHRLRARARTPLRSTSRPAAGPAGRC